MSLNPQGEMTWKLGNWWSVLSFICSMANYYPGSFIYYELMQVMSTYWFKSYIIYMWNKFIYMDEVKYKIYMNIDHICILMKVKHMYGRNSCTHIHIHTQTYTYIYIFTHTFTCPDYGFLSLILLRSSPCPHTPWKRPPHLYHF